MYVLNALELLNTIIEKWRMIQIKPISGMTRDQHIYKTIVICYEIVCP